MEAFRDPSLSPLLRAKDLLPRLTLREKVGQLNQRLYGFSCYVRHGCNFTLTKECEAEIERWSGLGALYGLYRADPWSQKSAATGIPPHLAAKAYNTVQRRVIKASRFGIPVLMTGEASHGQLSLGAYLLPVNLAMGATFNLPLAKEAYRIFGRQMKAQGIDLALMPVLDVLRDPRWGRSEECFGEDPLLCALMAEAAVSGAVCEGVDVVAKHLCAQGETTGGINSSPARIGPRELREIHLPPVYAALRGGAAGMMAAYNEIDGVPCHANPGLLRDFLRDEAGFKGIVMADGTAIDRLDEITGSARLSGALALESGVDVSLWDAAFSFLEEAVLSGEVDESLVDAAALRVLEIKFRRGLFENPYMDENTPQPLFPVKDYPQSLEAASQSVVLLENRSGLLPLSAGQLKNIAVIGPGSDSIYNQTGDYCPPLAQNGGITLLQGVLQAAPGAAVTHAPGCGVLRGGAAQRRMAVAAAEKSDVVILALGGSSNRFGKVLFDETGAAAGGQGLEMDCGEGVDLASLELPLCQRELFCAVCKTGKPVVLIVTGGRPYVLTPYAEKAGALLYSFYPGPWGGRALAELLFGKCQPGGRLPVCLPRHAGQLPSWYNGKYAAKKRVYCDMDSSPLYPFGYGKGYTGFTCTAALAAACPDGGLRLDFTLHNTGKAGGWAVPMLFIRWLRGRFTARKKELKQFGKYFMEAGKSLRLTLTVPPTELCRLDAHLRPAYLAGPLLLVLEEGGEMLWSQEITVGRGTPPQNPEVTNG